MSLASRTARAKHSCYGCLSPIPVGSQYLDERSPRWKGKARRWHPVCHQRDSEEERREALHQECLDASEAGWDGHKGCW